VTKEVVDLGPQLARQPVVVLEEADHELVVARVRDVGAHEELILEEQLADGGRNLRPGGLEVGDLDPAPVDVTAHNGSISSITLRGVFTPRKIRMTLVRGFSPVTICRFGAFLHAS